MISDRSKHRHWKHSCALTAQIFRLVVNADLQQPRLAARFADGVHSLSANDVHEMFTTELGAVFALPTPRPTVNVDRRGTREPCPFHRARKLAAAANEINTVRRHRCIDVSLKVESKIKAISHRFDFQLTKDAAIGVSH